MRPRLGLCALIALLFGSFVLTGNALASVNDVYISQNGGIFSGGSACNGQSTQPYTYFNNSANWTSGTPSGSKIGPGTVVYLCGTFTGSAGQQLLAFQGGGTSSNPITLQFDSGASLQAPYFAEHGAGGAVDLNGYSYLVVNGGTNGFIENTLNGTSGASCPGGSCSYQQGSVAIEGDGSTNIVIENLTIQDMYVHTSTSDATIMDDGVNCTYDNGTASGWSIHNNTFHDMSWCIEFQYNTTSGVSIYSNNIYNVDHGIAFGGPAAGYTLSNVNIYGNNIHDYSNWDSTSDAYHHDGIHIWGYSDNGSDTITSINIYDNTFGGCIGQDVTAHIFMEANNGSTSNVYIYNNTLIDTCSGNDTNGLLTTGIDSGYKIYNNTFMGTSGDICVGTSSSPSITFINNAVTSCGTLMYIATGGGFAASGLNNNIYSGGGANAFVYLGNYSSSFSTWQSETGQDSNSSYVSSIGLSSSGVPQSGSAVISAGMNLTGLGITTLDSDLAGNARPSSGAWTVGAYTYAGLLPPTGLTASAH